MLPITRQYKHTLTQYTLSKELIVSTVRVFNKVSHFNLRHNQSNLSYVYLSLLFGFILSLDFVSRSIKSSSVNSSVLIPSFMGRIIRSFAYMVRADGSTYSAIHLDALNIEALKDKLSSLSSEFTLDDNIFCDAGLTSDESKRACSLVRNHLLRLSGMDVNEIVDECIYSICQLRNIKVFGNLELKTEPLSRCINLINSQTKESTPLGARAYHKFKSYIVSSSKDISLTCALLSHLFIQKTEVIIDGDEDTLSSLGAPTVRDSVIKIESRPVDNLLFDLFSLLLEFSEMSEPEVGVDHQQSERPKQREQNLPRNVFSSRQGPGKPFPDTRSFSTSTQNSYVIKQGDFTIIVPDYSSMVKVLATLKNKKHETQ